MIFSAAIEFTVSFFIEKNYSLFIAKIRCNGINLNLFVITKCFFNTLLNSFTLGNIKFKKVFLFTAMKNIIFCSITVQWQNSVWARENWKTAVKFLLASLFRLAWNELKLCVSECNYCTAHAREILSCFSRLPCTLEATR